MFLYLRYLSNLLILLLSNVLRVKVSLARVLLELWPDLLVSALIEVLSRIPLADILPANHLPAPCVLDPLGSSSNGVSILLLLAESLVRSLLWEPAPLTLPPASSPKYRLVTIVHLAHAVMDASLGRSVHFSVVNVLLASSRLPEASSLVHFK